MNIYDFKVKNAKGVEVPLTKVWKSLIFLVTSSGIRLQVQKRRFRSSVH